MNLSFNGFFPPFSLAGSPPRDLLMCNSNQARSLWSLLCEIEDRNRFPELSESELTSLLAQKNSDNTKKATKVALNVFTEAKAAYGVMLLKQV